MEGFSNGSSTPEEDKKIEGDVQASQEQPGDGGISNIPPPPPDIKIVEPGASSSGHGDILSQEEVDDLLGAVDELTPDNIFAAHKAGKPIELKAMGPSGKIEDGWKAMGFNSKTGEVRLIRSNQTATAMDQIDVPLEDLRKWNKTSELDSAKDKAEKEDFSTQPGSVGIKDNLKVELTNEQKKLLEKFEGPEYEEKKKEHDPFRRNLCDSLNAPRDINLEYKIEGELTDQEGKQFVRTFTNYHDYLKYKNNIPQNEKLLRESIGDDKNFIASHLYSSDSPYTKAVINEVIVLVYDKVFRDSYASAVLSGKIKEIKSEEVKEESPKNEVKAELKEVREEYPFKDVKMAVPTGEHWIVKGITGSEFLVSNGAKLTVEGKVVNSRILHGKGSEVEVGELINSEVIDVYIEKEETVEGKISGDESREEMSVEEAQAKLYAQKKEAEENKREGLNGQKEQKEKSIQEVLDEKRQAYIDVHQKYLKETPKKQRAKEEAGLPEDLKKAKEEYELAKVNFGIKAIEDFELALRNKGISGENLEKQLAEYKAGHLFKKLIIDEYDKLHKAKAETYPPKEKGLFREGIEWYVRQPRWARLLITTGVMTGITFATGGIAANPASIALFAGGRLGKSFVSAISGQLAGKGFETASSKLKLSPEIKRDRSLDKLKGEFKEIKSLEDVKKYTKEYQKIQKKYYKSTRNQKILKGVVTVAAGVGTGIGLNMLENYSGVKSDIFQKQIIGDATKQMPSGHGASAVHEKVVGGASHEAINTKIHLEIGNRGPEGAIIDKFRADPDLAQKFGWDGKTDIDKWAGTKAHQLWIEDAKLHGYTEDAMRHISKGGVDIDPTTGKINLVDMDYLKGHGVDVSAGAEHADGIDQVGADSSESAGAQIDEGVSTEIGGEESVPSGPQIDEGVQTADVHRGVEGSVDVGLTSQERGLLDSIFYKSYVSSQQQMEIFASQIKAGEISAKDFAQYYAEKTGRVEGVSPYIMKIIDRDFNAITKGGKESVRAMKSLGRIVYELRRYY